VSDICLDVYGGQRMKILIITLFAYAFYPLTHSHSDQAENVRRQLKEVREAKLLKRARAALPDEEKGKDFFLMTAVSVLKQMEEDGQIVAAQVWSNIACVCCVCSRGEAVFCVYMGVKCVYWV
jgi:hypothetical protein